jgi:glycerophosphoryl diester phosphodiesterase
MLLMFLSTAAPGYAKPKIRIPYWATTHIVAHAGGNASGYAYTNSLEALNVTCSAPVKAIEVDFAVTTDNTLICTHDWKRFGKATTLNTFLSKKIYDMFTPITAATAIQKLYASGKYLVIDAKTKPTIKVYRKIIALCDELKIPQYKNYVIPQIYKRSDYASFEKVYNFPNGIFTLYRIKNLTDKKLKKIAKFCRKKHLVLTISNKRYNKHRAALIRRYKVPAAVHTVNSKKSYKKMRKKGASVIYTDKMIW